MKCKSSLLWAGLYQLVQQQVLGYLRQEAVWPNCLTFSLPASQQEEQQEDSLPEPDLPKGILSQQDKTR